MRTMLQMLSAILFVLLVPNVAFTDEVDSKLDDKVGQGDKFVAVFVRMEDQMFANGGDYVATLIINSASFERRPL